MQSPNNVLNSNGGNKTISLVPPPLSTDIYPKSQSIKVSKKKETTLDQLRHRQIKLKESINSSREANQELKYDKEVSDLNVLVQKQQRMLKWNGYKIEESKSALKKCAEQLESEREAIIKSEEKLEGYLKRKKVLESMVLGVTKTLMDGRRKRGIMLKILKENDSE